MFKSISIKGFRGIKDELVIDFTKKGKYSWQENLISENGILKHILLYGRSGTNKTNFGLFLLLVNEILNNRNNRNLNNFNNCFCSEVEFKVTLEYLKNKDVSYELKLSNFNTIISEKIYFNGELILHLDREDNNVNLIVGNDLLKDLNLNNLKRSTSILSFIYNNSLLDVLHPTNYIYISLSSTYFINTSLGVQELYNLVNALNKENVENYNKYIKSIFIKLNYKEYPTFSTSKQIIELVVNDKVYNFFESASSGQVTLLKLFTVKFISKTQILTKLNLPSEITINNKVYKTDFDDIPSLFYYDEFDAHYDYKLSKDVYKLLIDTKSQTIVTTHNLKLLNNDISRPDCYLISTKNKFTSMSKLHYKEIRYHQNPEKVFTNNDMLSVYEEE